MRLVVTGGAGYIGGAVAALLLESGHEVIVLDNLSKGNRASVPKGAKFVKANVADFGSTFNKDDQIDAVLHFAAFIEAGESMTSPDKYWRNNLSESLKLLYALKELDIKKFIFSSTAAVYGNPEEVPITENAPKNPTNTYGMTKLSVDMAISSYCSAYSLSATSLRYFNVAGAYKGQGERHNPETHIIPLALRSIDTEAEFTIYGDDYPTPDGTCIRDYIHIYDLARAHLLALDNLKAGKHTILNLGNGQGFSNREVIKSIERVTGKKLISKIGDRRAGDPAVLVASNKQAERILGWRPEKPELDLMVEDAWQFYKTTQRSQT